MSKNITGMSVNVSPGTVIVNGKPVEPSFGGLAFGIDRWGNWRLFSSENALPWYRRWLVKLAYWHRTLKPPKFEPISYDDGWDPDGDFEDSLDNV